MSRAVTLNVGSVVVDSLPFSQSGTIGQAMALRASGADCLVGYLGVISKARLGLVLASGMGFSPVTLAGEYEDGPNDELAQLAELGVTKGTTAWLDLEGLKAWKSDPGLLISKIQNWADAIVSAGYIAGLYAGVPQPLTSDELWKLRNITRYWKGQGRQVDRFGNLSEPTGCGWCMTQMYPSHHLGIPSTWVDSNMVGADYKGRTPTMMVTG